jgi:polyisoprenyl-phosphate glycosyltransferase
MKVVSFIIPVFRNEGSLRLTYEKIREALEQLAGVDYEFVFIDDGSDDKSLEEILSLREQDPKVRALSFSRNFGQVAAVVAGCREARGDAAVLISADLQDPASLLVDMIRQWLAGTHIVVCHRVSREDTFVANTASQLFYRLIRISNPRMPRGGFDYMLIDRQPLDVLNALRERNRFFQGDVLWLGFSTHYIPYHREKRTIGKSQWSLGKKVKYLIDGLLTTSYLPIRFISLLGFLTAFSAFLYTVAIVWARLVNKQPYIGWAPLMIVVLATGGVIMIMLGIIGEYVWRIYDETRERPLYIIRSRYAEQDAMRSEPTREDRRMTHPLRRR